MKYQIEIKNTDGGQEKKSLASPEKPENCVLLCDPPPLAGSGKKEGSLWPLCVSGVD
ncbi:MAG: hypothetical protein ACLFVT_05180 [Syntrophobacteria bacterium]